MTHITRITHTLYDFKEASAGKRLTQAACMQGAGSAAAATCAGAEARGGAASGSQAQPTVAAPLPLAARRRLQLYLCCPCGALRGQRAAVPARPLHLPRRRVRTQHPRGHRGQRHPP